MPRSAILLISCPDRTGLVATITQFLYEHNGNILQLDQHVDAEENVFFMRVAWDVDGFGIPASEIGARFRVIADPLQMRWELHFSDETPRMALFVSKLGHCLYDILARYQSAEWQVEIPLIVSNHPDMQPVAEKFGIDFHLFSVSKDNKPEQEQAQLALLRQYNVDFIVLARYMQILSSDFVAQYPNRIINIHHSFLPAFIGAKPYHAAHARGVKMIGATSHYVTADLDAGPILEQDTVRINHRDSVDDLIRKGKDVEKLVLSRAVGYHLRRQVLIYKNKTVIFA
ncbi:MAG TPA: formyltetrahydrofolate deformylase [Phototrophicaceae bacterium]|nr:formyltetrahydrofolate deformylase [Phototrophicaceae bacterium]